VKEDAGLINDDKIISFIGRRIAGRQPVESDGRHIKIRDDSVDIGRPGDDFVGDRIYADHSDWSFTIRVVCRIVGGSILA
jgi:hypothetical protein